MVALQVDTTGLHAVAANLAATASTLAGLAAQPAVHAPLASDETSASAAARLSEHGAVLVSRAADAAVVLKAAADAITRAATTYTEMDIGNRSLVSLQGGAAAPTPATVPAPTVNLAPVDVPILPSVREPEVGAALMEAGQPSAGASYIAQCASLSQGFAGSAATARAAAASVAEHLQGQAAPKIVDALTRYAGWSADMARHADALGRQAAAHQQRFAQAQGATPTTAEFTQRRARVNNAMETYNAHPSAGSAAAVTQAVGEYTLLGDRTRTAAADYFTGELPATVPPPPPVTPVTDPSGTSADPQTGDQTGDGTDPATGEVVTDPLADPAALGDPAQSNPASMLTMLVPSVLGGVLGAAAAIPQQIAGVVEGLASQATQGVTQAVQGVTKGFNGDPAAATEGIDTGPGVEPSTMPDLGGGGGGGSPATLPAAGGGGDAPAAALTTPPMYGMGAAASPAAVPLVGYTGTPGAAAPSAGMGGMPMMMPMGMGGMGGGGGGETRQVPVPDKEVVLPVRPNAEKGAREQRQTALIEDKPATAAKRTVVIKSTKT